MDLLVTNVPHSTQTFLQGEKSWIARLYKHVRIKVLKLSVKTKDPKVNGGLRPLYSEDLVNQPVCQAGRCPDKEP